MQKFLTVAAAFGALGFATPLWAHHAVNAQFDAGKEIQVTAKLVKLENINPHSQWEFTVNGAGGKAEAWHFESASPAVLRRAGIKIKEEIKPGQSYVVYFNPSRDGSHSGFMRALGINGRKANISTLNEVRATD